MVGRQKRTRKSTSWMAATTEAITDSAATTTPFLNVMSSNQSCRLRVVIDGPAQGSRSLFAAPPPAPGFSLLVAVPWRLKKAWTICTVPPSAALRGDTRCEPHFLASGVAVPRRKKPWFRCRHQRTPGRATRPLIGRRSPTPALLAIWPSAGVRRPAGQRPPVTGWERWLRSLHSRISRDWGP